MDARPSACARTKFAERFLPCGYGASYRGDDDRHSRVTTKHEEGAYTLFVEGIERAIREGPRQPATGGIRRY